MESPEPGPPGVDDGPGGTHAGTPTIAVPPVGSRVVVRHRRALARAANGPPMTDVIGLLVHADDHLLRIRSRRGDVEVPRMAVVAVKEVPPAPVRRGPPHRAVSVEDLEDAMVGAWPAPQTARLGDWYLRAAGGFTHRANSVLAIGDPGLPQPLALDAVEAWYAARGLPAAVTIAGPTGFEVTGDPVGAALLGRGYAARVPTTTLTASCAQVAHSASASATGVAVECSGDLGDAWLAAYFAYRSAPPDIARAVLTGSPEQVFAAVLLDEQVLAIGRLAVAAAWGGIAAMWVLPGARRRGLGGAVLGALAGAAAERRVRSLHLQTDTTNEGALALYRRHGFEPHHDYVTLRQSSAMAGSAPTPHT